MIEAKKKTTKSAKVAKVINKPVEKEAKPHVSGKHYIETLGKRKTASARVRLFKGGKGQIIVNGVTMAEYFKTPLMQMIISDPLKGTSLEGQFDITAKVVGGGKQGQAEALRHGIARALLELDKELRPTLKAQRWLTRDARKKERKKPGLKRARRAPQWSKR